VAIERLVQGIHHFQREIFDSQRELFERLAHGQNPTALFITCSDSRINPNLITQTDPGELFILRNAGNIVPPHNAGTGGEAATIEFAVAALGVRHIIICGHSHCGAMSSLSRPEVTEALPAMRAWLAHAEPTRRIVQQNYSSLDDAARDRVTIKENVLVQLEHLRTHPAVAAGLNRGDLHLHGWVYKIETGAVLAFDPSAGQFVSLAQSAGKPASSDTMPASVRSI
jgi:carbonic anhydrase